MQRQPSIPGTTTVHYPESDGKPMAESTIHRKVMAEVIDVLEDFFTDDPTVWVGGNLLCYYEEGNPKKSVSPDVLVVFGVRKWDRPILKTWEEGKLADVVIEVTSSSTRREDLRDKLKLYERLGVREYYLFDPLRDYLEIPLKGFRRHGDVFEPLSTMRHVDGVPFLFSDLLGLELQVLEGMLRLRDPRNGRLLENRADLRGHTQEARQRAEQERERAEQERERAEAAEAEVARLNAEVARLRKPASD